MGHQSSLTKFKKIEIISSIFSDHDAMRLDINYKKKSVRNTNTWRLNNMFPNNQKVTEELKREVKTLLETNDSENLTTQNLRDAEKAVLRGEFTEIQSYLKKQEKHQIDHLTLHLEKLEKGEQTNKQTKKKKKNPKLVEGKKSKRSEKK